MKSKRKDGRGHWPAGKRRNADGGNWGRTRLAMARFFEAHSDAAYAGGAPSNVSMRALARELGCTDRTVRRYVAGETRPPIETQDAIEQWLVEARATIKRRAKC